MNTAPAETDSTTTQPQTGEATDTRESHAPEFDDTLVNVLAAKILIDWLRNRQQLLVPFTLDFQKLERGQVKLLLHALVAAAHADGAVDPKEQERLEAALKLLKARDEDRALLASIDDRTQCLNHVLAEVRDVKSGAMVYAVSLLAIDQRKRVNRYYLRYLAARLQLPIDLARNLERRFRTAV